jgi:hypothetical protein
MYDEIDPIEVELAEYRMCSEILEYAKVSLQDPATQARFEAWKKEQKTKRKSKKDER